MRNKNADEILKNIDVASPCSANWDDMVGDERLRFCGSCEKNVYNFSEMSKAEITQLLTANNYNVCGRFYRRADGTILTDDCPVGLRAVRKACGQMYKRIAAGIVLVLSIFANQAARADSYSKDSSQKTQRNIWTLEALSDLYKYLSDASSREKFERREFFLRKKAELRKALDARTQLGGLASYAVSDPDKNSSNSKGK